MPLRILPPSNDISPHFVNTQQNSKPPKEIYQPVSNRPLKGASELSKEERHGNHLRKKRWLKVQKRKETTRIQSMAKFDDRIRHKLEREKAMQILSKNKNVSIVGSKDPKSKQKNTTRVNKK